MTLEDKQLTHNNKDTGR